MTGFHFQQKIFVLFLHRQRGKGMGRKAFENVIFGISKNTASCCDVDALVRLHRMKHASRKCHIRFY